MKVFINKSSEGQLKKGLLVKAVDVATYKQVSVCKQGDSYFVIDTTQKPYTSVNLYTNSATSLNLTEKETKELLAKGEIIVYRSSGEKDGDRVLTRAEQIANNTARTIAIKLVDGQPIVVKDSAVDNSRKECEIAIMQ